MFTLRFRSRHTTHLFLAVTLSALGLSGCQKADDAVVKKLDEISGKLDKLDAIERSLASGGPPGAGRPPMPSPGRPDSDTVYSVPVDGNPFTGPEHAKITLVKGFEFACPFCLRVKPTLDQLQKDYGNDIKIVYKNYVVHPQVATIPAQAACAAHKQGKYQEMYDGIWEKGFNANRNLSAENMEAIAKSIGLNASKFKADMEGDECKKIVQTDQAQLAAVGTRGTPAFYINGRFLSGAQPIDRFKAIIDEELKKANEAISKGTKLDTYYTDAVLKKGKKSI
jgi:protein-disulfide isomerase